MSEDTRSFEEQYVDAEIEAMTPSHQRVFDSLDIKKRDLRERLLALLAGYKEHLAPPVPVAPTPVEVPAAPETTPEPPKEASHA